MQSLTEGGARKKKVSKSKAGLPEGLTRATMILNEEDLDKLRSIAYWESFRRSQEAGKIVKVLIREVTAEAIAQYVKKYESKHGKVKPIPED